MQQLSGKSGQGENTMKLLDKKQLYEIQNILAEQQEQIKDLIRLEKWEINGKYDLYSKLDEALKIIDKINDNN